MSVALQVLLMVVAIVVAVAGIGIALALRLSARQPRRHARDTAAPGTGATPRAYARTVPQPHPASMRERRRSSAAAAKRLTPEQAHRAKLVALQALLAQGDAHAERARTPDYADTQTFSDDYAVTQFGDDAAAPPPPLSLLNLDGALPRTQARR